MQDAGILYTESTIIFAAFSLPQSDEFYKLDSPPTCKIFYSTKDRLDAEKELESITDAMKHIGSHLAVERNPSRELLLETIGSTKPEESALIVFVMAHGKAGMVQFNSGYVEVQEMLAKMDTPNLRGKPKVLVMQACRGVDHNKCSDDGCHSEWKSHPYFEIKSPDTLVIMSAYHGSLAARNVMIPSLAKAIRTSRNDADICEIFHETAREIMKIEPNQAQEMRSTLRYKLCLRQVRNVAVLFSTLMC